MDNQLSLTACIKQAQPLRYTPAGLPVLVLTLSHQSWQTELGERYLAKLDIEAKLMGQAALVWQHRTGSMVRASGFLSHKSLRFAKPVLHIQHIDEIQ